VLMRQIVKRWPADPKQLCCLRLAGRRPATSRSSLSSCARGMLNVQPSRSCRRRTRRSASPHRALPIARCSSARSTNSRSTPARAVRTGAPAPRTPGPRIPPQRPWAERRGSIGELSLPWGREDTAKSASADRSPPAGILQNLSAQFPRRANKR
jgi:hypothetical protein